MKIDRSYNWSFGVKNERATRNKHAKTIERMKKAGVKYNDIIYRNFDGEIVENTLSPSASMWFIYRFKPMVEGAGKLSKAHLRELKTYVNSRTYDIIQRRLIYNGFPKSWATAFYMAYYTRINNMMTRVAKEIVAHYL